MEPEIIRKEAFTVAGCFYRGTNANGEIPQVWDREFLPRVGELGEGHGLFYGACRVTPECAPGEFEYLACAEVQSPGAAPEGMVVWEIPAQTYAVLPANDIPDLGRTFEALHAWVSQSADYTGGKGECFELYPDTYPEQPTIYVYVPIERKA